MKQATKQPRRMLRKLPGPNGTHITRQQIAEALQMPQSTVDKMVRGETRFPIHTLVHLWEHFELGSEEMLEWAGLLAGRYLRSDKGK